MSNFDTKEKKSVRMAKEKTAQTKQIKLQEAFVPAKQQLVIGKLRKSHALDKIADEHHPTNPRHVGKGKSKLTKQELQFNERKDD